MSEFKAMKFWCEDHNQFELVAGILSKLGYTADHNIEARLKDGQGKGIVLYATGVYASATTTRGDYWFSDLADVEEINIDWMRTKKVEYVELGGKKYIKEELEEALSKINPVN